MTKRIAVINDLSAFGGCSLTAAVSVLSAMGHRACPLPTAALSHQSEIPNAYCADLTEHMPRFISAWEKNGERFDGILTGYFSCARQLDVAAEVIEKFRAEGCLVVVDPVMGDNGSLYPAYDPEACEKMKRLAAAADVVTPNLTELCLLTGEDYAELTAHSREDGYAGRIAELARRAASDDIIVTGIVQGDSVCCIALSGGEYRVVRSKRTGGSFSGTGDIFSSVVCGSLLKGRTLFEAAQTAASFIEKCAADTAAHPHDPLYGIDYEQNLRLLTEVN